MGNFEQKLSRLEELSSAIKRSDISLEDALAHFEEGIKLARSMQQYLDEMEGKVQILTNPKEAATNSGAAADAQAEGDEKPHKKARADGKDSKASKTGKSNANASMAQNQDIPALALFDDTTATTTSSSDIKGTRA